MPKFIVGVTASISITIEAPNEASAEEAARYCVENMMSPDSMEVTAWNEIQAEEGETDTTIEDASSWSIDSSAVD